MRFRLAAQTAIILFMTGLPIEMAAQIVVIGEVKQAGNGQILPGASVSVGTNSSHGEQTVMTKEDGRFTLSNLAPGEYSCSVSKAGFLTERFALSLAPRQVINLEVSLKPARGQAQSIEVVAETELLDHAATQSATPISRTDLDRLPAAEQRDMPQMIAQYVPGAIGGHDNFVHLKGNELSLHQFIDGVSFLENPHAHFTPGFSPQIIQSVNVITGGIPAEFGNRLGGVLDIVTKSGGTVHGGSLALGAGTRLGNDAAFEYGGTARKWDYYLFSSGFEDSRYLNPPQPNEIRDLGYGASNLLKIDYTHSEGNRFGLMVSANGANFQLPNTTAEWEARRDSDRRTRETSAVLRWEYYPSSETTFTTAFYNRYVSDRLVGTTDDVTPFAQGFRRSLTDGLKFDAQMVRGNHAIKTGVDGYILSPNEDLRFDPRDPDAEISAFQFRGRRRGGEVGLYVQDKFSLARNFTVDLGIRCDHYSLATTDGLVSPRIGLSYFIPKTHTVLRAVYNRFFIPPPVEYVLLGSALGRGVLEGNDATDHGEEGYPGPVRALTQHYFETGLQQQFLQKLVLDVSAFHHQGRNGFENTELSDTRIFAPTNFAAERTWGTEMNLRLKPLPRVGLFGYLNYAYIITSFFGPVSGGVPEDLEPGQKIPAAFDQRHTGSAALGYFHARSNTSVGFSLNYGSGTPATVEGEAFRLPQHLTANLWAGRTIWHSDRKGVDLQVTAQNISDNVYGIAKESEVTPIQYSGRRRVFGRLKFRF